MLDEFILEQLNHIEKEYLDLNQKLSELTDEEKAQQEQLNLYLDTDDLGVEVFSPRSNASPIKERIAEAQKHLEELRLSQMNITDQIARNRDKEEKYQQMLNEARMNSIQEQRDTEEAPINDSNDQGEDNIAKILENHTADLKEILGRIETCINLVNHDRTKCKNELKNLRYYLKALIANGAEDTAKAENVSRET